ncbi:hypothetical protein SFC42_21565 [Priestia filamentosa]|uniref:hypothetical protein n=1 Tax=Priestia filamentosa TaxID=1402861 RepID=UPI00398327F3
MFNDLNQIDKDLRLFLYDKLHKERIGTYQKMVEAALIEGYEENTVQHSLNCLASNNLIAPVTGGPTTLYPGKTIDYMIIDSELHNLLS